MYTWWNSSSMTHTPQSHNHALNCLSHTLQFNLLCVAHVNHSLIKICFIHEYALQFNAKDFHRADLHQKKILWSMSYKI